MESSKKIKIGQVDVSTLATKATTIKIELNCNVLGSPIALSGGIGSVIYQITIPANTFQDLDSIEIESLNEKTGTAGTSIIRLYTDPTTTYSGSSLLLATGNSLAAGNLYSFLKREFVLRSGSLKAFNSSTNLNNDEGTNALATNTFSTTTFNPAIDNTLFVVGTGNASDSLTKQNFKITIFRNKSTI